MITYVSITWNRQVPVQTNYINTKTGGFECLNFHISKDFFRFIGYFPIEEWHTSTYVHHNRATFSLVIVRNKEMWTLTGLTRIAFLGFFSSHVVITLMIDGQACLPSSWYPISIRNLLTWYTVQFKDENMTAPIDLWLKSFISCELIFQLPFFVYATHRIYYSLPSDLFRSLCLVYGAHTSTTLIPILTYILSPPSTHPTTSVSERFILAMFYFPYLLFPAWIMIIAIRSPNMFGTNQTTLDKKKDN